MKVLSILLISMQFLQPLTSWAGPKSDAVSKELRQHIKKHFESLKISGALSPEKIQDYYEQLEAQQAMMDRQLKEAELRYNAEKNVPGWDEANYAKQLAKRSAEITKRLEDLKKLASESQHLSQGYRQSANLELEQALAEKSLLMDDLRVLATDIAVFQGDPVLDKKAALKPFNEISNLLEILVGFVVCVAVTRVLVDLANTNLLGNDAPGLIIAVIDSLALCFGSLVGILTGGAVQMGSERVAERIKANQAALNFNAEIAKTLRARKRETLYWDAVKAESNSVGVTLQAVQAMIAPYACFKREAKVRVQAVEEQPTLRVAAPEVKQRVAVPNEEPTSEWSAEISDVEPAAKKQMRIPNR